MIVNFGMATKLTKGVSGLDTIDSRADGQTKVQFCQFPNED